MANFNSVNDLKKNVLTRCGELTDGTSDFDADALKYITSIHQSVISGGNEFGIEVGEDWSWARARRPLLLTLLAPYETGTIALTNGSLAGTFSAAPAISLAGYHLKLANRSEVFRIEFHTAASTSFTIDGPYTDETITGSSYTAFKLDYDLFDDNIMVDATNNKIDFKLQKIQTLTFDADFVALNVINLTVNAVAMTAVTFATSHNATLAALATQLTTDFSEIGTATVTGARVITITAADAGTTVDVAGVVVTLGASQPAGVVAVTQVSTEKTATITAGMYTTTSLGTTVGTTMDTAGGGSGNFTLAYDTTVNKFTLSHSTQEFLLMFGTGTNALKGLAHTIGFIKVDTTSATSNVGSFPIKEISRLIDPLVIHKGQALDSDDDKKVYFNDPDTFSREYPLSGTHQTNPTRFTVVNRNPINGIYKVRFNGYPSAQLRLEVPYIPTPVDLQDSANDYPLIPVEYVTLLEFGASYYIMLDKSDSRADNYLRLAQAKLQALITANRKQTTHTSKNSGRLIPRVEQKFSRNKIKTISGLDVV